MCPTDSDSLFPIWHPSALFRLHSAPAAGGGPGTQCSGRPHSRTIRVTTNWRICFFFNFAPKSTAVLPPIASHDFDDQALRAVARRPGRRFGTAGPRLRAFLGRLPRAMACTSVVKVVLSRVADRCRCFGAGKRVRRGPDFSVVPVCGARTLGPCKTSDSRFKHSCRTIAVVRNPGPQGTPRFRALRTTVRFLENAQSDGFPASRGRFRVEHRPEHRS